mgnify:CR=1 FL=1|jgi:RNA polymerase sigma factor (sigma-70 family)
MDFVATISRIGGTSKLVTDNEKALSDLLTSLPEEERVILTLFYLKSNSANEIAALLGVPLRAVENVLLSGRKRLLTALGIEEQ